MRYEKKYEIELVKIQPIYAFLKCISCKEIFHNRKVNSLYYDTNELNLFLEAQNGLSTRSKNRARFYDKGESGFTIENKLRYDVFNEKLIIKKAKYSSKINIPLYYSNDNKRFNIKLPPNISGIY